MGTILYYDSWRGGLSGTFWLTGALFSGGVVLLTSTSYFFGPGQFAILQLSLAM